MEFAAVEETEAGCSVVAALVEAARAEEVRAAEV